MLKPWLESKIKNSWVDPREVKSDKKLLYQYKIAWAFANAAQEILEFVEQNNQTAETLTNKQEGKTTEKKFDIGG